MASTRRHADEILPPETWEEVARHIKLAADRARFCMMFKSLSRPASLKACFLLHLRERLVQERLLLVSLSRCLRQPSGNLHPQAKLPSELQPALLNKRTDIARSWDPTSTPQDSRLVKRRVVALSAQMEAALRRLQSIEQTLRTEALLLVPHMKLPLVLSSMRDACLTLLNKPDFRELVLLL